MPEFVTLRDSLLEDQGQQSRAVAAPVANMAAKATNAGQRRTWEIRDATTLAGTNPCPFLTSAHAVSNGQIVILATYALALLQHSGVIVHRKAATASGLGKYLCRVGVALRLLVSYMTGHHSSEP
jgi:hypothetical protein